MGCCFIRMTSRGWNCGPVLWIHTAREVCGVVCVVQAFSDAILLGTPGSKGRTNPSNVLIPLLLLLLNPPSPTSPHPPPHLAFFAPFAFSVTAPRQALSLTYDSSKIAYFFSRMRAKCASSPRAPRSLTDQLLDRLFEGSHAVAREESRHLWREQEQQEEGAGAAFVYPPRRLQSVCSLWQAADAPAAARLALLVFLLFDTVAVTAAAATSAQPAGEGEGEEEEEPAKTMPRAKGVRYQDEQTAKHPAGPVALAIQLVGLFNLVSVD